MLAQLGGCGSKGVWRSSIVVLRVAISYSLRVVEKRGVLAREPNRS